MNKSSVIQNNDIHQCRINIRDTIQKICEKYIVHRELDSFTLAKRIERSCYNKTIDVCRDLNTIRGFHSEIFAGWYSATCYKLISNLDPDSVVRSHHLCDLITSDKINVSYIAYLTSYELCPAASQADRDLIDRRREQNTIVKVSRIYTCRKCGCNETSQREQQTRAADESSTIFIFCVRCGFTWTN